MIAQTGMGGLMSGLYAATVPVQQLIAFVSKTGICDLASPDQHRRGLRNSTSLREGIK